MSNFFKKLFGGKNGKGSSGNAAEETTETKKCLNCLKRVSTSKERCPHCRSDNFQYNS